MKKPNYLKGIFMLLSKEQHYQLNSLIEYIEKYDAYFFRILGEWNSQIYTEEQIKKSIEEKEERKSVFFGFPGEEESTSTEELLAFDEDIRSIDIIDSGHIRTKYRSIYIVSTSNHYGQYVLSEFPTVTVEHNQNIKIRLINSSIIIGLVATKLGGIDDDSWKTYSGYSAIEFIYLDEKSKLSTDEESDLIHSFIFEVADTLNIALTRSNIAYGTDDFIDIENDTEKFDEFRELLLANDGMKYFTSGVQIEDPELKFLSFYKVLEHFSPRAFNIDAFELMRKKLDAPKSYFDTGDYIKSLFDLSNSVHKRLTDEELIKSAFVKCFDFVGLFHKLPQKVQTTITKQLRIKQMSYSLDDQKITTASNMTATIIYKTRNNVVHAKSNFNKTGGEITSEDELIELNNFMKEASSQTIRWYSRLPDHQKIKII